MKQYVKAESPIYVPEEMICRC